MLHASKGSCNFSGCSLQCVFRAWDNYTCSRCALLAILRLYPHSLGLLAPVCSSFSFMCSSQAQRYWFSPLGNEACLSVKLGNVMATRCTLLCWLLVALEHVFILEQPGSAKFGDMPRWQEFCSNIAYAPFQELVSFTKHALFLLALICLLVRALFFYLLRMRFSVSRS